MNGHGPPIRLRCSATQCPRAHGKVAKHSRQGQAATGGDGIAKDLAPGGDGHAVLARAGPSAIVVLMLIPGRQQQDIKFTDCEQRNAPSLAEWDDELSKLPLLLASTACVRRK